MIIDSTLEFIDSTAVQGAVGTANVGDVIDLGPEPKRNIANCSSMGVVIVVEAAADGGAGGTGTVQFAVVSDDITVPDLVTATTHVLSAPFDAATLVQGKKMAFTLPQTVDYERYLGLQVIQGGEAETSLVASVFLTPFDEITWEAYPDAQN